MVRSIIIITYLAVSLCCWSQEKEVHALHEFFKSDFRIGAALNGFQITGRDTAALRLVQRHFNSITPENVMKWQPIHPEQNKYNFELADQFVEFGKSRNMFIVGHTLVWHNQIPSWVFLKEPGSSDLVDKQTLYKRMEEHISTVMERYKGRIHAWDVVNEAVDENGELRNSNFYKIAGDEYIRMAFVYAHRADPAAELYYNDYNLWKPAKRDGVIRLVKDLLAQGIRVDGIGMQGHWSLSGPSISQIEESVELFSKLGVKVMITELDITVLPSPQNIQGAEVGQRFENSPSIDPFKQGLPDSVEQQLAKRYEEIFRLFLKHRNKIDRVTFWGVQDGHSWKNNWPVRGRTDYPLLFNREYKPKAAFFSLFDTGD